MSTIYEYAKGTYHVHVKLKGDERGIDIFHGILDKCDGSWPWSDYKKVGTITVCRRCKGFTFSNPRITPQDIKAAAEQAGIGVKVYVFAPEGHCFEKEGWKHTEGIPRLEAKVLYSHKPKRLTVLGGKIYIGTEEAKPETHEHGKLIVLASSTLVN